jgi:hypothetical protein
MMDGFGCCVLTDWDGTAKVSLAYFAINTAAKAGAGLNEAVRQQTGAAWLWRSTGR